MTWRLHQSRNKEGEIIPKRFDWCQVQHCEYEHFIYTPFNGGRPAQNSWEGVKH